MIGDIEHEDTIAAGKVAERLGWEKAKSLGSEAIKLIGTQGFDPDEIAQYMTEIHKLSEVDAQGIVSMVRLFLNELGESHPGEVTFFHEVAARSRRTRFNVDKE
jgi:hypothetical protein